MSPEMFRRFMRPTQSTGPSTIMPGEIRVDLSDSDKSCEISAEVKCESEDEKKQKGQRTVVKELL